MPERSPLPLIPRDQPDDMVLEIERLRDMAEEAGLGTLAYLLEVAMIEAKHVSNQARRDSEERQVDPRDLWRLIG